MTTCGESRLSLALASTVETFVSLHHRHGRTFHLGWEEWAALTLALFPRRGNAAVTFVCSARCFSFDTVGRADVSAELSERAFAHPLLGGEGEHLVLSHNEIMRSPATTSGNARPAASRLPAHAIEALHRFADGGIIEDADRVRRGHAAEIHAHGPGREEIVFHLHAIGSPRDRVP
jgi:hypothetical protein